MYFVGLPVGRSSELPFHKTMLLSPGVKPLIGQNIQGSRATSGNQADSRIALGSSPGVPHGTLCQRWNQEGKKNDPAGGEETAARVDNEVGHVNMETLQNVQRCGVFLFFLLKNVLVAAVKRLIYNQSVFHLSFSPSLPNPFLKDCTGEYTGSIKPF